MANIIWKYNSSAIRNPLDLGSLEHLQDSSIFPVVISHDSNQEIVNCQFYLSKFSKDYSGTLSPKKDYERLLWLANNYPGYGLSIRQRYEVTGQIDGHDSIRILDHEREEKADIFTGSFVEILSGDSIGETAEIASYDPEKQLFLLNSDFTSNVKDVNYKISIDKETFFKTGQGADYNSAINLVHKGGVIQRFNQVEVELKLRIPKFAQSAGIFSTDLEMQFTSLEE